MLYQVGDFFEAYADDAEVVGTALDLTQTTRAVDHNTRVPMVGFPQHRLETYLTMLTDRGYDVEVNALEDGKRITRHRGFHHEGSTHRIQTYRQN